ncbi:MAG: hypothetical protein QNJ46_33000 [Leptolyngbyaceae cyanobacterium MO_188.B28]|nr:hypothetical protein [Leptolyngbyaceae cyanobacterium MO_188.B28]
MLVIWRPTKDFESFEDSQQVLYQQLLRKCLKTNENYLARVLDFHLKTYGFGNQVDTIN